LIGVEAHAPGAAPRWVILAAPLALLALFAGLWLAGLTGAYFDAVRWFGVTPYRFPFEDTEAVVSMIQRAARGEVVNLYTPAWLAFARLPVAGVDYNLVGFAVVGAFFASLLLLPRVAGRAALLMMIAASVSSAVVFGVERANMDLALFALAALAATLAERRGLVRLAGYGLLLLGGLLKFYPIAGLALALREKPGRFLAVLVSVLMTVAAFVLLTRDDLARAVESIPMGYPLGNMFGSVTIGAAILDEAHLPMAWVKFVHLPMCAAGIALGFRMGVERRTAQALAALTGLERTFLLTGAMLVCFCFFGAQNIGYRATFLLLVLPGLLALREYSPLRRFRLAPWWGLALMWHQLWRARSLWLAHQLFGKTARDGVQYLVCVVRELMWWALIVVLLGYVVSFAVHSPVGRRLLGPRTRRRGEPAAA
jgi:hypothetical protein